MIVDHKIKIRKNQNFGKIALRNIFLRNMQIKPLSIEDAGKNQSRLLKESSFMNKGGKPIRKSPFLKISQNLQRNTYTRVSF